MDIFIDPISSGYSLDQGRLVRDPVAGLANAVYLRLMTPLGSYWADPSLGSRLHELQRDKDVARVVVLAKQYAELALKPILADGRATAIAVTVVRTKDSARGGRHQLVVEISPASGELQTFQFPLSVI